MSTLTKIMALDVKSVGEDGTFTGVANMTGIVDLGGDIIHAGAFTKTLTEKGGKVYLFADHSGTMEKRVGLVELQEINGALEVTNGVFNLAKAAGQEAYADAKFYHAHGIPLGLSIGYRIPAGKSYRKDGTRHITEVQLGEVSIVAFPMNQQSQITGVKSMTTTAFEEALGVKAVDLMASFEKEQQRRVLNEQRWKLEDALSTFQRKLIQNAALTADAKVQAMGEAIDQYKALMLAWLAQYLALDADPVADAQLADPRPHDTKALNGKADGNEPGEEPTPAADGPTSEALTLAACAAKLDATLTYAKGVL
jgi:HK97 family phage prohead protease